MSKKMQKTPKTSQPRKKTPNPTKPYTQTPCLSAIFMTSVNLTCDFQTLSVSGTKNMSHYLL